MERLKRYEASADDDRMRGEVDPTGTWLCPTEFDRSRMLDMEGRLQWARAVMFGALGIGFGICVPWLGWAPVALVAVQVAVYALLRPLIAKSTRPEYPIAFAVVLAQVLIALAVALTDASQSPLLIVFLLGIVGLPARFGTTRVVAAGLLLTELLIFAATAGVDPSGFAAHPAQVIVTATASFGLVAFAHALMLAESQKRSDSVVDALTGLPNRRSLEARFTELRASARGTSTPLALLLCDLDLFKAVNDSHGHQRGDAVLVEAGEAIQRSLRPTELVYRIGGEEFLILLPGCDLDLALPVAERVREAVESARPGGLPVTASVGLGAAAGDDIDFDTLFRTADAALYEAKRGGRNQVVHQLVMPAA
jgi:diguanylate cyclase (GGDEF)-like protein